MTVVRIPKNQLRKGMYIEAVECPVSDFSKRRFILDLEEDVDAIAAAPAEFVFVNTARGVGTGAVVSARTEDRAREADEARFRRAAETLSRATTTVKAEFANFISGEKKSLDDFKPVSQELRERMAEGPVVLLEMTRLKTKDEGTFVHSIAVAALMTSVGQAMGYDEATINLLGISGILHDCGKLLIPSVILNKRGSLTDVERQIVRNHPELGYQRLLTYPDMPEIVLDICRYHHEFLDGSGYPHGLRAEAISPFVRISTICDVFDALTSIRPYKNAWTAKQAIAWMFEQGDRFDRKLLLRLDAITAGDP